jgi:hypothetical protein
MLRLAGDNQEVYEQAVFAAWRVVAGAQLTRTCVPFRLHRKYLIIAVPDDTWKQQMELMSGELIFKLDSLLGSPLVIFIEFRVDPAHVARANEPKERPFEFHHTQELEEELKPAAAAIKDEALRAQFLRAAAKSLERLGA